MATRASSVRAGTGPAREVLPVFSLPPLSVQRAVQFQQDVWVSQPEPPTPEVPQADPSAAREVDR